MSIEAIRLVRDVLKELYEKKITGKEARAIWKNIEGRNAYAQIGINSLKERYAVDEIPFKVLAKWRYEGWPLLCAICGKPCDMDKDKGVPLKRVSINGKGRRNVVVHWDCRPLPYAEFKNTLAWEIIEKAVNDLEANRTIYVNTTQDRFVGYMARAVQNQPDISLEKVIEKAFKELQKNNDLQVENAHEAIKYIVQGLEEVADRLHA